MSSSTVDKTVLVERLHQLVTEKVASQWATRWSSKNNARYGSSFTTFSQIVNRNGFYLDLKDEVDKAIKNLYGYEVATQDGVSSDSIQRLMEHRQAGDKTLNAMAIYVGFRNWEAFCRQYAPPPPVVSVQSSTPPVSVGAFLRQYGTWLSGLGLVILLGWVGWYFWPQTAKQYPKTNPLKIIQFVNNLYAPTQVTFAYDLRGYDYDSAFVNLEGRKISLLKVQDTLTHTYVFPQLYNVYMRIDTAEYVTNVLVKSKRWVGTLNWGMNIAEDLFYQKGYIQYPKEKLPLSALNNPEHYTSFRYVQEFGVMGDSAVFEIRAKNSKMEGGVECFDIGLNLVTDYSHKQSLLSFNIMHEGCVQYIHIRAADTHVGWKAAPPKVPLTGLGAYSEDWLVIKAISKNQTLYIYINDQLRYTMPYQGHIGPVKLMQIDFKGSGMLDYVKLSNSHTGKVMYFDDFN